MKAKARFFQLPPLEEGAGSGSMQQVELRDDVLYLHHAGNCTPVADLHSLPQLISILQAVLLHGTGEAPAVSWMDMSLAPKDNTLLFLKVRFTHHPTDDEKVCVTIGGNNALNDGVDRWQFAGWDWEYDHFVDGEGEPIGWLPLPGAGGDPTCRSDQHSERSLSRYVRRAYLRELASSTAGWQKLLTCWPGQDPFKWVVGYRDEATLEEHPVLEVSNTPGSITANAEDIARFYASVTPVDVLALLSETDRLDGCENALREVVSHVGGNGYETFEVDPVAFVLKIKECIRAQHSSLVRLAEERLVECEHRPIIQRHRFTGCAEGLSISFDAPLLGDKVEYNEETGTLVIKGVPAQLMDQLKRHAG